MPGGAAWRARMEASRPESERHLVLHEGHNAAVSQRDRPPAESAGPGLLIGWTGPADTMRGRLEEAVREGATEVLTGMAGTDIPRDLRAFARAAGL